MHVIQLRPLHLCLTHYLLAVYMKAYQQLQNRINHSTTSDIQNMEADWEIPEQHKTWEDILRYPRLNDHV